MEHFYQNIGENWFSYENLYSRMVKKFPLGNFLEVGSWKGRSAAFLAVEIQNSQKDIKLYCVDTWKGSDEHVSFEEIKNGTLYDVFLKNVEPVKHIITPIRKSSTDAAKDFEDDFFDFIFIDAAHDYDNVYKDMCSWYPKLKVGGFFAGHDYDNSWIDVKRAVHDWIKDNNVSLEISGEEMCWGLTKK